MRTNKVNPENPAARRHPSVLLSQNRHYAILLVTVLTVGFETIKAAVMNPVNALRRE